ncbi:MAG: hypothetical protein B6D63_02975 [Candidatus Latescibacteria bacterium 4484_7]|nr:MAG: hypothetical protein B6D63_02975 [Candidatus Latescibacteria bacterium 4484_7]
MRRIVVLIGSFFYTGFFPVAPATFASFLWLLAYLFIPHFSWLVTPYSLVVTLPLAVFTANEMEKYYGHDAHEIVIDEVVGMQITLLLVRPDITTALIGFVLFRVFDIAKPFPVGLSQKLRGGYGVVIDDFLAGVYSRVVLFLIVKFIVK